MPDVSLNDAVAQIKDEIVRLSNNASFKKKLKFYLYTKLLIRPFTAPKVKPVEGTAFSLGGAVPSTGFTFD